MGYISIVRPEGIKRNYQFQYNYCIYMDTNFFAENYEKYKKRAQNNKTNIMTIKLLINKKVQQIYTFLSTSESRRNIQI